jgi:hypothetical protein
LRERRRLDLTQQEFERRLAAHEHDADAIRHLWDELATAEPEREALTATRQLDLGPRIAVYLGLVLVVAACSSVLALYWEDLGSGGILVLAAVYLGGFLAASETLRRRDWTEPAGALTAMALAWVAVVTYAVQARVGVWPEDADNLHGGFTVIAVAVLAATAVLAAWRPGPLLIAPCAAATTALAIDLSELVFDRALDVNEDAAVGDNLSPRQALAFVVPVGLAWIGAGLWFDVTRRRRYATWAHWCGLVLAGNAVLSLVPKTVPGFTIVGVLGAVALFFSAFVRHWSFTVFGALGVLIATAATFGEFGRIAPVAVAAVGVALIVVGLRWSGWRDAVSDATLRHVSPRTRELVQRLAP